LELAGVFVRVEFVGGDVDGPHVGVHGEAAGVVLRVVAIVVAEKDVARLVVASVVNVTVTIPVVSKADNRCIVRILNPHLDGEAHQRR